MTAGDVDALDKLREAATAGPWQVDEDWIWGACGELVTKAADLEDADAALIVAAVNALPDLLAEVRRGRALREAVDRLCGAWDITGVPDRAVVVDHLRAVLAAVDAS